MLIFKKLIWPLIALTVMCVCLFVGYKMGQRPRLTLAAEKENNQIYAIVDGKKYLGEDVADLIKDDLQVIEKNKYLVKKAAVEKLILADFPKPQNEKIENITVTDPGFIKFTKNHNVDLRALLKKADQKKINDLLGNYKIQLHIENQKKQAAQNFQGLDIQWKIPLTYLDPPVDMGPGFLSDLSDASATKKIIVFANYHCPYCAEAQRKITALKEIYKDDLSIRFRFSMKEHEDSAVFLSALAAGCANEQNKFSEIHTAFFKTPPTDRSAIFELAETAGLDMKNFRSCLDSKKYKDNILSDISEIEKQGHNREAVAYVNGYFLQIQDSMEAFELLLNQK